MSEGTSSIGSCMAFSAAAPATEDAAGYAAATWTASTEVESIGEIGPENEVITFKTVCDGLTHKRLGATDYGSQSIVLLFDSGNAAQGILSSGARNKTKVWCRETLATGDVFYYGSYVAKTKVAVGGSGDMIKMNTDLAIDGVVVEVAA